MRTKYNIILLLTLLFIPLTLLAETKPRWVSKGVKELNAERSNDTYVFHIFNTYEVDRVDFKLHSFEALEHFVDSVHNEGKGSVKLDSVPDTHPTIYTVTYERDGKPNNIYAQLVDSYEKFEQHANGDFECDVWQLFAVSSRPNEMPRFDEFTLSREYNGLPTAMSIIPGLGQIYKGQKAKGYTIMGAEALLITGIIYSSCEFNHYINEAHANPQFYDNYKSKAATYQQLRLFCAITGGALYVYNLLDAAISKGARYVEIKRKDSPAMQLSFIPMMSPEMAGIGINLRF